jgi:hypothetical protein
MNKFFIAFAAIASSGILAYANLREWISIKWIGEIPELIPEHPLSPYFHGSVGLYQNVLAICGVYFFLVFLGSLFFTWKRKWGAVMLCFVASMLGILGIMINGAIK